MMRPVQESGALILLGSRFRESDECELLKIPLSGCRVEKTITTGLLKLCSVLQVSVFFTQLIA
jgi:hypothetical protein